ncbi:MAG: methyltransferase domain-containing protein [Elusimicrobia bacterium]|nr:methyltransferase domain-containing protein [Elusimicrobiota bacterium]
MAKQRDYNQEIKDQQDSKYCYHFDSNVMHPFILRSFIPFFRKGNMLELGSYRGDFTVRLQEYFDDITCVEASSDAVAEAEKKIRGNVKFITTVFNDAVLSEKYDNIVLVHVLEHIEEPVTLLKKIRAEWLADNGRLFLVCPNAHAPSRQIAVHMGLLNNVTDITDSEARHGHRITFTAKTLEKTVKSSRLHIIHRSGIFFKAFANFQWDMLLHTDIISDKYLEGCYELGKKYPDLCSSIFFVCGK